MTTDLLALLDRLETVHAAATPPPWRADLDRTGGYDLVDEDGQYITDRLGALDEDNAAAIVAEHNAYPLLSRVVRDIAALADELDRRVKAYDAVDHIGESDSFDNGVAAGETTAFETVRERIRTALASAVPDTTKD